VLGRNVFVLEGVGFLERLLEDLVDLDDIAGGAAPPLPETFGSFSISL